MPINWQTRGEGPHAHRYHRLAEAQARAAELPDAPGVYELAVDGEAVYTWAVHTPAAPGRPLRYLPVVYAARVDAETFGEVWATRDRGVYWAQVENGERSATS